MVDRIWELLRSYVLRAGPWNVLLATGLALSAVVIVYVFRAPLAAALGEAGTTAFLLIAAGLLGVATAFFLWLFAGQPTVAKVDAMVRFAYAFTLVAIGGSFLPFLFLPSVPKVLDVMHQSPVGIVRGCSEPADGDDDGPAEIICGSSAQWLVNLGGIVLPPGPSRPAGAEPGSAEPAASAPPPGGAEPEPEANAPPPDGAEPEAYRRIKGGLVVPLYFVILSLMGAAVGMARRVPEYQRLFSNYAFLTGALRRAKEGGQSGPPHGNAAAPDPGELGVESLTPEDVKPFKDIVDVGGGRPMSLERVREHLVFQIMQVVSAPLIAIVAYHLIEPDSRSVTVAVGFAAGFGAEPILVLIRRFASALAPEIPEGPARS